MSIPLLTAAAAAATTTTTAAPAAAAQCFLDHTVTIIVIVMTIANAIVIIPRTHGSQTFQFQTNYPITSITSFTSFFSLPSFNKSLSTFQVNRISITRPYVL